MMKTAITREQAYALLRKYNQDPFHLRHGRTVEEVMRHFARELGYGEEEEFWGCCTTWILRSTLSSTASRARS